MMLLSVVLNLCLSMEKLQVIQKKALRIATGFPINNQQETSLRQECNILPVRVHCTLITKQNTSACHLPGHLMDLVSGTFIGHLYHSIMRNTRELKEIQTQEVNDIIINYPVNKVLGTRPPQ